jgi:adenylosuccinate synthase
MSVTILVGGQWGDEGKGKVIDLLADGVDMVVRSQGGNNAGHTVVSDGREFRFQLIPSGILYPHVTCVIGHGMVVDPKAFLAELDTLRRQGISSDNLVISDRAHMVMPYHPAFDKLGEQQRGDDRLGTTARGIGPTYEDKVRRIGFRIGDLQKPKFMEKKLRFVLRLKNEALTKLYGVDPYDEQAILEEYMQYGELLERYIRDIYPIVQGAIARGDRILLEGAQGVMLDIDLGRHPAVAHQQDHRRLQGVHHPGRLRSLPHRAPRRPRRAHPRAGRRVRHRHRAGAAGGVVRRLGGPLRGEHQRHPGDVRHQARRSGHRRPDQDLHRVRQQG